MHASVVCALAADEVALLEAAGADVELFALAVNDDTNALDVGFEGALDLALRVRDGTTGNGMLAADIANFRHFEPPAVCAVTLVIPAHLVFRADK